MWIYSLSISKYEIPFSPHNYMLPKSIKPLVLNDDCYTGLIFIYSPLAELYRVLSEHSIIDYCERHILHHSSSKKDHVDMNYNKSTLQGLCTRVIICCVVSVLEGRAGIVRFHPYLSGLHHCHCRNHAGILPIIWTMETLPKVID